MAIEKEITLPCGATLRNRLAKSAMSENLAFNGRQHEKLWHLYETWRTGDLGLIITANIMIDRNELGEPNNVMLDCEDDQDHFRKWTTRIRRHGAAFWAQLNDPGRWFSAKAD